MASFDTDLGGNVGEGALWGCTVGTGVGDTIGVGPLGPSVEAAVGTGAPLREVP